MWEDKEAKQKKIFPQNLGLSFPPTCGCSNCCCSGQPPAPSSRVLMAFKSPKEKKNRSWARQQEEPVQPAAGVNSEASRSGACSEETLE